MCTMTHSHVCIKLSHAGYDAFIYVTCIFHNVGHDAPITTLSDAYMGLSEDDAMLALRRHSLDCCLTLVSALALPIDNVAV